MYINVTEHYDKLIEEENDPFRDPPPLRRYMDKWDGQRFIDLLHLSKEKSVLEIGVGTGRLAAKTAPYCRKLCGIDISPKTIARAKENLSNFGNVELICIDFLEYEFRERFDIIYFSLTSMHFENKQELISKIRTLLEDKGRFVFSIDKNQDEYIDMENRKLKIYPDNPADMNTYVEAAGMNVEELLETELAYIFACSKR